MGYFMGYYTIWLVFVKSFFVPFLGMGGEVQPLCAKFKAPSLEAKAAAPAHRIRFQFAGPTVRSSCLPSLLSRPTASVVDGKRVAK